LAFCSSLHAAAEQNGEPVEKGETQRSEGWQGASVGAVSAKMLFGFCFGAKAALRARDRPSRGRTAPTRAQRSGPKTAEPTANVCDFNRKMSLAW